MPVGFKNATDGDVQIAVNAIVSSRQSHSFIGITREGKACIMQTLGNPDSFLILRGGRNGTNYDRESVSHSVALMKKAGLRPAIVVDCSHGNSQKMPENQIGVLHETIRLRKPRLSLGRALRMHARELYGNGIATNYPRSGRPNLWAIDHGPVPWVGHDLKRPRGSL
jgi:hypothetical protein